MNKILLIFGTRPELIKLAPIIHEFEKRGSRNELITINTNQHNSLLFKIVEDFKIKIDYTLDIDNKSNNLSILSAQITSKLESLFRKISQTDTIISVIIQGDTTSTYCASLVAFYNKIDIHYVEAGLRTYDKTRPFPEEFHRRVISHAADYLYAPTQSAKHNLIDEGFERAKIILTGNTIIDSILLMDKLNKSQAYYCENNTVLCTIHRRENQGEGIIIFIESIIKLAKKYSDYKFVIIRHPNPKVKEILDRYSLNQSNNLTFSDPVSYAEMLNLIKCARLIISDSGGLQEEACFFLKPIIILRNTTERIESIQNNIAVCTKLDSKDLDPLFKKMKDFKIDASKKYLYGTGNAAQIIVKNILRPKNNNSNDNLCPTTQR